MKPNIIAQKVEHVYLHHINISRPFTYNIFTFSNWPMNKKQNLRALCAIRIPYRPNYLDRRAIL